MSSGRQNANSSSTIPGSLRPRVNRLISIDDELQSVSNNLSSLTTNGESSLFGKWPLTNTSNSTSTSTPTPRSPIGHRGKAKGGSGPSSLFSAELWTTSWSSVQDVATTILGNNLKDDPNGRTLKGSHSRHRSHPTHPYSLSGPSDEWGPSGNSAAFIAAGTTEDRRAELQAKKREALLAADAALQADTLGKYKRKPFYDRDAAPSSSHVPEHEVLVYLHHVLPSDTLAGLSIRYGCSQEVIRKTNRLWPNDTIQIRKQAYLPIDSCTVRGRRVEESLLDADMDRNAAPSSSTIAVSTISEPNTTSSISRTSSTTKSRSLSMTSNATSSAGIQDVPWTHASWTILPTSQKPIEIVRLAVRFLGYFPPTRRKSIPYTDDDPLADDPLNAHLILASSPEPHPSSSKVFISQLPSTRSVSHSRTRLPISGRHNASPPSQRLRDPKGFLHGPGGVGTMEYNVRKPGPAPDRLNEIFGPHLPNLAPPSHSQPPSRLSPRASRSHLAPTSAGLPSHRSHSSAPNNAAIARTSFESVTSANSVAIVGDKIEGWMRKVAGRGRAGTLDPGNSDSVPANQGDLIELVESTPATQSHTASDSAHEHDEKERQRRELEERFPARGRVFGTQGTSQTSSSRRGW